MWVLKCKVYLPIYIMCVHNVFLLEPISKPVTKRVTKTSLIYNLPDENPYGQSVKKNSDLYLCKY